MACVKENARLKQKTKVNERKRSTKQSRRKNKAKKRKHTSVRRVWRCSACWCQVVCVRVVVTCLENPLDLTNSGSVLRCELRGLRFELRLLRCELPSELMPVDR